MRPSHMARAYFHLAVPIALLVLLALELGNAQARMAIMPALSPAGLIISPAPPHPRVDAAVLLARPLFSPRRRPVTAAPPPAPRPPRLSGIVVTGSGSYAIFVQSGGSPMIAAKGQLIGRFTIRDITTTQVTVSGPAGVLVLHTTDPEAAAGGASPSAATPSKVPAPIVLPGGITLYPATSANLPAAADWPGPSD